MGTALERCRMYDTLISQSPLLLKSHDAAKACGIVGEAVLGAVAALGGGPVAVLAPEQHLALLSFLCDEALDSALLRNLLQSAFAAAESTNLKFLVSKHNKHKDVHKAFDSALLRNLLRSKCLLSSKV